MPESWWLAEEAPPLRSPRLDDPVDVAVVGAGVTGCSCALTLAAGGLRVRVYEARTVASGASGRNGGFALRGGAPSYDKARAQLGADRARLRLIVGLYGAQTLVAGALNVLIVVMALELLDMGNAGIGFLNSAVGVGGLLGGFAALALLSRNKLASDFAVGLVLWGVPIALIGIFPDPLLALVLLGVVGIGVTLVDVAGLTLLQRAVPDEVMTRVFGVVQSVFVGTLGLGAIIAPLLIKLFDVRGALIASGSLLPFLAIVFWRRLQAVDGDTLAPAELALLRSLALFRPLPPATLDQLASALIAVSATDGDEIIRQGDSGDRFYVIAKGEVDVTSDGQHVSTLGKGDYFGEIALLRDVPRTATVTARGDVELRALERDEFLGAVTGHVESVEAADAVIANRLGGLRSGVASV